MKKFLSTLLALLMLLTFAACAEEAPTVYVSISDDTGALVLAYQPVALTDADGDGALTICDALMNAHTAYHPNGAEAFVAEPSEWGLSLYVLWGVDNCGSYGYCLNDASAMSLVDPVQPGDHVKAYVYTDLTAWSDTYAYFGAPTATAVVKDEVALTLFASGYDEAWNPVTYLVQGAFLVVDGEVYDDVVTDANGQFVLTFTEAGVYTISAVSNDLTLVPPVCIVTVTE